jgi:hypothetical protein
MRRRSGQINAMSQHSMSMWAMRKLLSKEPILKIIYKFYLLSEKVLVQLMIYLITYKIFQLFRASKKLNQGSTHDFLSSQYFCV